MFSFHVFFLLVNKFGDICITPKRAPKGQLLRRLRKTISFPISYSLDIFYNYQKNEKNNLLKLIFSLTDRQKKKTIFSTFLQTNICWGNFQFLKHLIGWVSQLKTKRLLLILYFQISRLEPNGSRFISFPSSIVLSLFLSIYRLYKSFSFSFLLQIFPIINRKPLLETIERLKLLDLVFGSRTLDSMASGRKPPWVLLFSLIIIHTHDVYVIITKKSTQQIDR